MMSDDLARRFHDVYERLAPEYGYTTRTDTREFDPQSNNGRLMIAVCGEVAGEQQAEIERLRARVAELEAERDEYKEALYAAGVKYATLRDKLTNCQRLLWEAVDWMGDVRTTEEAVVLWAQAAKKAGGGE